MENIESNLIEKNEKLNSKSRSTISLFSPKVVSILLIVNLVIGIFTLVGVGYLSFKTSNRSEMTRNFPNGGFNPQNGGGGNFQAPGSSN